MRLITLLFILLLSLSTYAYDECTVYFNSSGEDYFYTAIGENEEQAQIHAIGHCVEEQADKCHDISGVVCTSLTYMPKVQGYRVVFRGWTGNYAIRAYHQNEKKAVQMAKKICRERKNNTCKNVIDIQPVYSKKF